MSQTLLRFHLRKSMYESQHFPSTLFASAAHISQNHWHDWPPSKHAHINQNLRLFKSMKICDTMSRLQGYSQKWLIRCFHFISISDRRSRSQLQSFKNPIYTCNNSQITNNRLIRQVSHHPNQMLRSRFALQFWLVHITACSMDNLVHPLTLLPSLPSNNMGYWYW